MPAVYWNNQDLSVGVVPTVHMAGPAAAMQGPGYSQPYGQSYGQPYGQGLGPMQPAFVQGQVPFDHAAGGKGMSQYPKTDAPPPYGMNPQMQPGAPPVAVVVGGPPLGPTPANITCPSCHAQIQTRVTHESSTKTHIIALLLCLFGCWPCVCLPYCMDSCQNANHHCPACGTFLGTFKN